MSDPVTTIQTAAATAQASASLFASLSHALTSLAEFLPTIAYAITAVAAFFPPPSEDAPKALQVAYRWVNFVAFNVKHARNATTQQTTQPSK